MHPADCPYLFIRRNPGKNFPGAKQLKALNQHQVRNWPAWYRWTTLAMPPSRS